MRILIPTILMLIIRTPVLFAQDVKIHDAAKTGDLTSVRVLLEKQPALINAKNKDGQTPLHIAATNGRKEVVELLLEKGADVNAKDNYEGTPLHWAAYYGHKEVAELLLSKGAAINAKERKGWTPIHYAVWKGHKELAELLISSGADIDTKQMEDSTPLHIAAMNNNKEMVELLIAKGAKSDAKDQKGNTPLQYAIAKNQIETSILLYRYECTKVQPAISTLPPKPNIADRYKWKSKSSKVASSFGVKSEGITVTEMMKNGERGLSLGNGQIGFHGQNSVINVPGCRDIRIRIDPKVGVTHYAGLAFKTPSTLDILEDFTLDAHEEGVIAQDKEGNYWISRPATISEFGNTILGLVERKEIPFFQVKSVPSIDN